ncbi:MAG TPA: condensation domain-containing protein [Pyrinomonadaceae bacterium]|nr:condensation domain-containing protein [Pyrinomonadaceae bacterium]
MSEVSKRISALSPEKLELLMKRLEPKAVQNFPVEVIPRRQIRSPRVPLTYAQERMWVLYQLDPSSSAFNISLAVKLEGKLDVAVLKRALATVVRRHEVLRTTFDVTADGRSFQSVHPPPSYWPLPVTDLRHLPQSERAPELRRLVSAEAARPFNLQVGPTFRTSLICQNVDEHALLLSLHHIIADGWSIGILVREITVLYAAFAAGAPSPLTDLPIQYADFAVWQRQWLQGEVLQKQLDYWRRQFTDLPGELDLPTDFPRQPVQSFRGEREFISLSEKLSAQLKVLGQREGATLFMTLLATFQLLLHQYSGQDNILIGTNIANRNRGSIEKLIGFFVNNIVLRTNLSGNPTFRQLLARARDVTLGAYAHQDVPFEMLLEDIRPERKNHVSPLFQVMLVLQNAPFPTVEVEGLKLSLLDSSSETSNFDLVLFMTEAGRQLTGQLDYNTDLFTAATVRRLLDRFQNLLRAIAADPEARIDSLSMSTLAETAQLTGSFNAPFEESY